MYFFNLCRRKPEYAKKLILSGVRAYLGPDYDVDKHFTPRYNPWEQRLCLVPDADLFMAIRSKKASVVTDQIETFTETGLKLKSGSGTRRRPDRHRDRTEPGNPERRPDHGGRRKRRSREDLQLQGPDVQRRAQSRFVLRLHQRLVDAEVRPDLRIRLPAPEPHAKARLRAMHAAAERPLDHRGTLGRFFIGLRAAFAGDKFPKQGSKAPWKLRQNYARDIMTLRFGRIDDGVMEFSKPIPELIPKRA